MPPEAEFLFVDPDPRYDAESLALYSQDPAELSDAQIEQRARAMVSRLEARLSPEHLAALANSVDTEAVQALFRLIAATGYPDARLTRTLEREFLTAIDPMAQGLTAGGRSAISRALIGIQQLGVHRIYRSQ